jgi:hypothetical protein
VVVMASSITSDELGEGRVLGLGLGRSLITLGEADDALGPGKDGLPVEPAAGFDVSSEVAHGAVFAGRDEGFVARVLETERLVRSRHAHSVEAELAGLRYDALLHVDRAF